MMNKIKRVIKSFLWIENDYDELRIFLVVGLFEI
jgi:hypothetical protein